MKGILCRETYPDPDARISSDEDLYVLEELYSAFHQALLALGFSCEEPDYQNAHEVRYFQGDLMIEGHWELFPQDSRALDALNALTDDFWESATVREIGGVPLRVLEPTDHMTFLLLHAFKHFVNSGVGVRQICDVAQYLHQAVKEGKQIDDEILDEAIHIGRLAARGQRGAAHRRAQRRDLRLVGHEPQAQRQHHARSVENAENASRAKSLLRTAFPNRAVMETSFPWVRKSALILPAAWSLRIVRYLRSRGEGNSASESLQIGAERLALLKEYKIL